MCRRSWVPNSRCNPVTRSPPGDETFGSELFIRRRRALGLFLEEAVVREEFLVAGLIPDAVQVAVLLDPRAVDEARPDGLVQPFHRLCMVARFGAVAGQVVVGRVEHGFPDLVQLVLL